MSAAAQPSPLPRTPSTRRQQQPPPQSYNSPDRDARPHRTQSATSRSNNAAPSSPRRSMSSSQQGAPPPPSSASHSRTPSSNLQNVAQRDFEQSNVARPASTRRSESHDRPVNGSRRENDARGHARTHSRYSEQPTPASTISSADQSSRPPAPPTNVRRRKSIDATTGHWELGKTIGAGSMGKVKLARNKETGEHVAVKIVPRQSTDGEHRTIAERERADHSKEIRTAREAAIVTLVDHPYICGMRDVVRTNYHWYMLFEYVNGGQMLDYIISHGRLKEKQARKFGRQIASSLDYCHRNSIVHRDLKIENILISKNGDIKIIDFGLSNLFSPRNYLKTFCGSLYFAAPELLQAKQYTGPEVDVWSFGIVLYVLVCGKVPFDDQSMPQLHAKIKKGFVEYPPWLSPECRNLIARMLTTNPSERATLQDIMNHPWMTKGFNGPPDNYLPSRKPVQLPLDPAIIDKMTGFDFGAADVITAQLTKIIESEDYQRAIRNLEKRNVLQTPEVEKKRGVFDFYKRRNSINSRDTLNTPSSEAVQLGQDPVNAFHPLISIYYLAQEKQEREAREKNPGALAMPQDPNEKLTKLPDLPAAPEAAYTNAHTAEMAGEKPTGGRSRPRARTHGEDEVQQGLQNLNVNNAPNPTIVEPEQPASLPARKESAAAGLLRRLSTRRHKEPPERLEREKERSEKVSHPPSSLAAYGSSDTPRKSFSVRRTRDRDGPSTRERESSATRPESSQGAKGEMLSPQPAGGDGSGEKKRTHGLGRSVSVNSSDIRRRLTRRGASEGASMRPPMTSSSTQSYGATTAPEQVRREDPASDVESRRPQTTGFANRARSMGHNRRESMQARRAQRNAGRQSDVPEETDADIAEEIDGPGASGGSASPTGMKPVYLKGLFSVSTTSSRPLPVIRADIIRVLKQLGVEYREIRGGFSCKHSPSIVGGDENSNPQATSPPTAYSGHQRKISFGRLQRNTDRDEFRAQQRAVPKMPSMTSEDDGGLPSDPDERSEYEPARYESRGERDINALTPRPTQSRPAGETSTHVQSDMGSGMALRFEILLVKVPLLSLHGVQFKKVDGGTWQYKNMAQMILGELRL
ncbi:Serine/threonine-protein kinase [Saxophila tyrrhenica]|uniref:non-specific serine/threonine protein kinase n=1 Tax=Saxophila tyrrhenica TaxID=1690608 RepID=A0AAV9NXU4_9PEZI|nr:Serine/threonine-protein kinase [Saxophila tyrrhenica]